MSGGGGLCVPGGARCPLFVYLAPRRRHEPGRAAGAGAVSGPAVYRGCDVPPTADPLHLFFFLTMPIL